MDDTFKESPLPSFKSIDEECAYWKERYAEIKQKLIETKHEFVDFEENSRQLEAELETCLEQREKTIQDLKHSIDQLQTDNESLRVRIIKVTERKKINSSQCILMRRYDFICLLHPIEKDFHL